MFLGLFKILLKTEILDLSASLNRWLNVFFDFIYVVVYNKGNVS